MRQDPGGGGINVARGLHRLGTDVLALFPAGGYHGALLCSLLEKENVPSLAINSSVPVRENWTIFTEQSPNQYRFVMPGPSLNEDEWNRCLVALEKLSGIEYIVVSGSMPPDFPENIFERIGVIAKKKNARLLVDTSGDALRLALEEELYMIKPSLGEMESLIRSLGIVGKSVTEAAKEMISLGFTALVFISKGAEGAVLVSAESIHEITPPKVSQSGTIGAGDSLVAGFIYALTQNYDLHSAAEFAVACGAATTMSQGTALFQPEDARKLYESMKKDQLISS